MHHVRYLPVSHTNVVPAGSDTSQKQSSTPRHRRISNCASHQCMVRTVLLIPGISSPILVPKLFTRKTNRSFVAVQYTVPRVRHSNVAHCTRITNLSKQGSHLGPSGITFRCLDSYPQAHQSVNPTCQGGSEICRLEPSRPLSSERIDGPALTTAIVTPQVPSGRT